MCVCFIVGSKTKCVLSDWYYVVVLCACGACLHAVCPVVVAIDS